MKVKCYLTAILLTVVVFTGAPVDAATSALTIGGIVREPPQKSGKTLGGWPVGAYTDRRRSPETFLASVHANEAGLYNLLARNVPSDLEEAWILSDTSTGVAVPVPVKLPNPMEPLYNTTADELIVNLRAKALTEREAAVNYTSAVIKDQSIRVVLGLLAEDFQSSLAVAKINVTQRAGLVVVKEYSREGEPASPYDEFWAAVRGRIDKWDVPRHERLSETLADLTNDLLERTVRDPNPSSYAGSDQTTPTSTPLSITPYYEPTVVEPLPLLQ
jgi:hypothetical protein